MNESVSSGDHDHEDLTSKQGLTDISQVQVQDEIIEEIVVESDGEYGFEEVEYEVEVEEERGSSSEEEYEYEYEYEQEEEADDSSAEYIEEVITTDDEEEVTVVSGDEEEVTEVTLTDRDLAEEVTLPEDEEFDKDLLEEYYQLYGNERDGTVLFDITKLQELADERKNPGKAKTDFVPNLPTFTLLAASKFMAITSHATARVILQANEKKVKKKTKKESNTKSKKMKYLPKSSEGDKVESVDPEETPVKKNKKKINSSSKKVKTSRSSSGREKNIRSPKEKKLKKEKKPEKKKSPSSTKSDKSKLAIANLKMLMSPRRTSTPMEIKRKLFSPKIASHYIPKAPRLDNSPVSSPSRRAQSLRISTQVAPPLHALDDLLPADKDKLMRPVQELKRSFNTNSPHVAQFLRSPNAKLGISIVKKGRVKNVMPPPLLDDGNQQSPMPPPNHPSSPPPQETDMQMVNERISTGPTSDLLKQMRQSFDPTKSPLVAQFLRSPNAKLGLALAKTNRPSFKVPSLDDSDSGSGSDSVDEEQERSFGPVTPAQDSGEATPLISTAEESSVVRNRTVPLKDDICEQFGISQNGSCVRHQNINVYNFEDGSIDICRICRSENHSKWRRSMAFTILEVQDLHLSPGWKKWHDKVNWVSDSTNTNNEQASEETGAPISEEKRLRHSNIF